MNDRRVERVERHRDEGVYSSRIERDKKEQEKYSPVPPKNEKEILIATFFNYLKNLFDTFSPSKKLAGKVVDHQSIIEHLKQLQALFQQLAKEDLSNSPDFATQLSDCWCALLEDFDFIEILERKNLTEVARFREMMDIIKNYPPESEHRFGYYLLQHAGKDWLPFPFIEILKQLHTQHQEQKEKSTLSNWLTLIDQVLNNLKSNWPPIS